MRAHGTRSAYVAGCHCDDCRAANRTYADRRARYGWSEKVAADWTDAAPVREHVRALMAAGMGWRRIAAKAGVNPSAVHVILYGKRGQTSTRILRRNADAILAVRADLADGALTSATGSVRRIRALQAMGWTLEDIGSRLGISKTNLGTIAAGVHGVTVATARKIAKVYDDLSMTYGPSDRTRSLAARRGWLPPLAWDDELIDDPSYQPFSEIEKVDDFCTVDEVAVERFIAGDLDWRALTVEERLAAAVRMDRAGYSRNVIAARVHVRSQRLWAAFASESDGSIAS